MSFLRNLFGRKQTTVESSPSKRRSREQVASIIRKVGARREGRYVVIEAERDSANLGNNAVGPLIRVLKHRNVGITVHGIYESEKREVAAHALGQLKHPRAVEPLIKALGDEYHNVVREAAKALGKIGDPRAVRPLITALKHQERYVRAYAAEALGKIGDANAVEALIPALMDVEGLGEVQDEAAKTLGNLSSRRAVEPLIAALKSGKASVRQYAAEALGKIGDPSAVEALEAALHDEEYWVREKATEALKRIRNVDV